MIDLIVVNYKTYGLIHRFLESYRNNKPSTDSRVILIDNESNSDMLYKMDLDDVDVYPFKENLGYAGACNFGANLSGSKYMAFLNSDTEFVDDKCVDICVQYMEDHDDVAVVGPLQYASDGRVTHGGIFGTHSKPEHRGWHSKANKDKYRDVLDAVTVSGSAYFLRRSVWDEMSRCPIYREVFPDASGGFAGLPHFFEETIYSYHVFGHGYKCVYLGEAEMIHQWHKSSPVGSQNANFKIGQAEFRRFCEAHGLEHD